MTDPGVWEIDIDLGLYLSTLADEITGIRTDLHEEREIERARVPTFFRLQNSGIIPTPTAPLGMNFGGPSAGYEWIIRGIIVGGLTWGTTAAGTAEVYITGLGSMAGTSSSSVGSVAAVRAISDLVDQSSTLPNKAFYGRDEMIVKENESISVVIVGGTAGQQYSSALRGQEVRTPAWKISALGI